MELLDRQDIQNPLRNIEIARMCMYEREELEFLILVWS